jgi:hypothetical protein
MTMASDFGSSSRPSPAHRRHNASIDATWARDARLIKKKLGTWRLGSADGTPDGPLTCTAPGKKPVGVATLADLPAGAPVEVRRTAALLLRIASESLR